MNTFNYHPRNAKGVVNTVEGKKFPWQTLLIVVLALALIVSLIVSFPSADYRNNAHELFITRMQTECGTAVNAAKMLSRTISSNSNAQLALIRSSLYAMDVLNQTYASLESGGQQPIPPATFTSLYAVIDSYYAALATGTQTTDAMAALTAQLDALQSAVMALD